MLDQMKKAVVAHINGTPVSSCIYIVPRCLFADCMWVDTLARRQHHAGLSRTTHSSFHVRDRARVRRRQTTRASAEAQGSFSFGRRRRGNRLASPKTLPNCLGTSFVVGD